MMRPTLSELAVGCGVLLGTAALGLTLAAWATEPTGPPLAPSSSDPLELIKWGGPWVAFIVYALKELKERRQVDEVVKRYEQIQQDHVQHLTKNTEALTQLVERIKTSSKETGPLVDHLTYNTRVLTKLVERIEATTPRHEDRNE